jgi:hypothetical protein
MTKLVGSDKADLHCNSTMLNLSSNDEAIDLIGSSQSTNDSLNKIGMKNFELLKMLGTGGMFDCEIFLLNYLISIEKLFFYFLKLMVKFFLYESVVEMITENYML